MNAKAQGWYRDPYGMHHDRYFSDGTATKLVRDDENESFDPPPDLPVPAGDLIPVVPAMGAQDGSDLLRAGETQPEPLQKKMRRAVIDYFETLPKP